MHEPVFFYGSDFIVREVKGLPPTVEGAIMYDEDGRANIYINADLPDEKKKAAVEHELWHMINDDLHNEVDDIRYIEGEWDDDG